jgi:sporulation protein YlmC with PRC-barrel domain
LRSYGFGVGTSRTRAKSHLHRMTRSERQTTSMGLRSGSPVMRLDFDMPVCCVDGSFGELVDVVIDPRTRRLTHLVVQPHNRHDHPRLVPIEGAADSGGPEGISLESTVAEISRIDSIEESAYVRRGELQAGESDWDVGIQEIYALPEYGALGPEALGAGMTLDYDQHVSVSYHRVPKGGVEVRRATPVTSGDGHHLGHLVGFVVDDQEQIAHLVLEHGHLWGKRHVAIPGHSIERFQTDELTLSLSSDEVGALKPLPTHRSRSARSR